jgi:hypothetical protein
MGESVPNRKRIPIWADDKIIKVANALADARLETPIERKASDLHRHFEQEDPDQTAGRPRYDDLLGELGKGREETTRAVREIRKRGLADERCLRPLMEYLNWETLRNPSEFDEAAHLLDETLSICAKRTATADLAAVFFYEPYHFQDPRGVEPNRKERLELATWPALHEIERRMARRTSKATCESSCTLVQRGTNRRNSTTMERRDILTGCSLGSDAKSFHVVAD